MGYIIWRISKLIEAKRKRRHRWFHSMADGHAYFFPSLPLPQNVLWDEYYSFLSTTVVTSWVQTSSVGPFLLFCSFCFWPWTPGADSCYTEHGGAQREPFWPLRITQWYMSSSKTAAVPSQHTHLSYREHSFLSSFHVLISINLRRSHQPLPMTRSGRYPQGPYRNYSLKH